MYQIKKLIMANIECITEIIKTSLFLTVYWYWEQFVDADFFPFYIFLLCLNVSSVLLMQNCSRQNNDESNSRFFPLHF